MPTQDSIDKALDLLSTYLEDCDHSVGICFCEDKRTLETAKADWDALKEGIKKEEEGLDRFIKDLKEGIRL